jgi:hypothetical protein
MVVMDSVKDYFFLQFSNKEFKMDQSDPSFSTLSFDISISMAWPLDTN